MPKEAVVQKSKKLIRHHLCALMKDKPYDEISVTDICAAAEISRMSFYRYYNKKDDVFLDYADERFAEFFDLVEESDYKDSHLFFVNLFVYLKKYQRQLQILQAANKQFLILSQFVNYVKFLTKKFQMHPAIGKVTEGQVFFIAGGLYSILIKWMNEGMKASPEEMADDVTKILTKPLIGQ